MKKLMIAAAIVCAAAISQAATWNWKSSVDFVALDNEGETCVEFGKAFFFDNATVAQSGIGATLAGGNLDILDSALGSKISDDVGGFNMSGSGISGVGGDFAKGYFVIFQDDAPAAGSKFWVSDVLPVEIDGTVQIGGNANFAFGEQYASSGWQTVAAPEPTSGLLLLIGVAGLALRRRRA